MNLTIVTVCYNAQDEIKKTIESVLAQSYTNYEYLIIDGKSNDATLDIVDSYKDEFARKTVSYQVVSEKDNGIYDAMNKAIDLAKGKWIIFLNAGDVLCEECILEKVFVNTWDEFDVIYGDTILRDGLLYKKSNAQDICSIKKSMPFCHQSILAKSEVLKKIKFLPEYRIAADYEMFLRLYAEGKKFAYVGRVISIYKLEGFSNNQYLDMHKEFYLIRKKYGFASKTGFVINIIYIWFYYKLRGFLKKYFSAALYSPSSGWAADYKKWL